MNCIACGSTTSLEFEALQLGRDLKPERCWYFSCMRCGLASRRPPPSRDELKDYYENAWQFSEPRPADCLQHAAWFIAKNVVGWTPGPAIDVGSKKGEMFPFIKEHLGITEECALDAKPSPGVAQAWIGEGYRADKQYQLVLATHVLEHAIDPVAFLDDLSAMLSPTGYLYVEVPSLELGAVDAGLCDDLNPNHLWHFTIASLAALCPRAYLEPVAVRIDPLPLGWPVIRLLARKANPERLSGLRSVIHAKYDEAAGRVVAHLRPQDAFYGASGSCFRLLGVIGKRPIFDLYKHGREIAGHAILDPAKMIEMGVRRVWLTPRFWNSQVEIKRWLNEHYPTIEVLSPYA